jgi:hypothetical protein
VFNSNPLSVQTTSYGPPAGVLQVGVDYVYGIILADAGGGRLENVSRTFSEPFRFTIAGDFNTDGTVDAADYAAWRKNSSGDQAMYDTWRTNFGTSLGPGSGSAGYPLGASARPLSAAVPEPSTFVLTGIMLAQQLTWHRRKRGRLALKKGDSHVGEFFQNSHQRSQYFEIGASQ